jgi:ribosomal protein S18 acetylase RimI-like enzyme
MRHVKRSSEVEPIRSNICSIRDTHPKDAKAVSVLIDAVARERRYLAGTSGFSEEATASFIASVRAAKGVHVIALVDGAVVGWCDIAPASFEGMTHVGRLGMGVKADFRGQGIGKRLLKAAVNRAFRQGLERVELQVFRSNDSAVRLYEAHGFLREGVKVGARKLDGMTEDLLLFATFKSARAIPGC